MIGFMPVLYEDELCYSWFARYCVHAGYDAYSYAREDLFARKNAWQDIRFLNRLNEQALQIITGMISMEELILNHTMFPLFRFTRPERLAAAFQQLVNQSGSAGSILPFPKLQEPQVLRYCPVCAVEDRTRYGETYWHRSWIFCPMNVCVKHKCRLVETDIAIRGAVLPRMYTAEETISLYEEMKTDTDEPAEDMKDDTSVSSCEMELAEYLTQLFYAPVHPENRVPVSEVLKTKLEGTKYLSSRGKMRNISLLTQDFLEYYRGFECPGMTELQQIQKCFTGYRWNFYDVGQLAFFLKIPVEDLVNQKRNTHSQTDRFNRKVAELYDRGLGCYRIADMVKASPSTVRKANKKRQMKSHNHAVRTGMHKENWELLDAELLPEVQKVCEEIYSGIGESNSRPRRVTQKTVERRLGMPQKRLDCLSECKKAVHDFYETQEMYWAREVIWAYRTLQKDESRQIYMRSIINLTNMRKQNLTACIPYLNQYGTAEEVQSITALINP